MTRTKIPDILILILKIVLVIALLLPFAFFTFRLVEGRITDLSRAGKPGYFSGYGLYFFLSMFVLLGVNLALLILTGLGLLAAHLHRTSPRREKHIKFFQRMFIFPVVSQILYSALGCIIATIH